MRCAVKGQSPSDERSAGDPHATFCGSRERVTAPGHPVAFSDERPYRDRTTLGWFSSPRRARQVVRVLQLDLPLIGSPPS